MWLARSLPSLLSRLRRPASAHRHSLLLGGTSRAYASAAAAKLHRDPVRPVPAETWPPHLCNSCGAKQEQRRRHLYVVLDDWKHGFSLHKISSEDLVGGDNGGVEPRRLPDPILRFDSRSIGTNPGFHALGSNVVVTTDDDDGLTLVYDTETATLRTGNRDPPHGDGCYHAVAAGNNLYTVDSESSGMLNLDEYAVPHWEVGPGPTEPFTPHKDSYVSACALHPDGRTIFVSVRRRSGDYRTNLVEEEPEQEGDKKDWSVQQLGTFALDTQSEWGCWTQYGSWYLPFEGQAHYDGDLGVWVGKTHAARDSHGYRNDEHEHLCSYDVPDLRKEEEEEEDKEEEEEEEDEEDDDEEVEKEKLVLGVCPPPVPGWSLAAERLTFLEPKLKSTGRAVLLHTGGRGTFCLVERALRKGVSSSRSKGDRDDCLLRVTMCRIRYGRNGELVAAPLRPSRSYLTSRYAPYWPGRSYLTPSDVKDFDVRAFWI